MGLLNQQTVIIFSALIISPFITCYITTILFYRKARSKALAKTPPTVPFYVPGIFHAFGLASTGPQKYFAQIIKDYGDFAPFYVSAGPQGLLVVRDTSQVKRILTTSKSNTFSKTNVETLDKLFGMPQAVLDIYTGKNMPQIDRAAFENAHTSPTRKYLAGTSLATSMETYATILSENMNNKMFQAGSWTQIEDTWSFFQQVITRCTLESLFGTDLFKQYPGVIRDYWDFSDAVEGFVPGLPRYWVPAAALQAQGRILQGIEKWLKANHSGSEFARIAGNDPIWDECKGSKFIQERDAAVAGLEGMTLRARAAVMLSIMHESNSIIIPCVIWSLLELLRRPLHANALIRSTDRYSPSQGATYNIAAVTDLPLMDSVLAETARLRVASILVHTEDKNLQLDDHWLVPQDTPILLFSHDMALNANAWAKARLRSVETPLEQYWAERFLVPTPLGSKANQRGQRNDVGAWLFSLEGLESLHINLCGNRNLLLGQDYMRTLHAVTLSVLLQNFELQLCDSDMFDAVVPPVRETAFGTMKPLEKVAVRIRKRLVSRK